jgi:hypothetical protein
MSVTEKRRLLTHGQHVTSGLWEVLGPDRVSAGGTANVIAYGRSTVRATGRAIVRAQGDSLVIASDGVYVEAVERATVVLLGRASAWAAGQARIFSFNEPQPSAPYVHVGTCDQVHAEVRHADVSAEFRSRVLAMAGSSVRGTHRVRVEARERTAVMARDRARILVSAGDVKVILVDRASMTRRLP